MQVYTLIGHTYSSPTDMQVHTLIGHTYISAIMAYSKRPLPKNKVERSSAHGRLLGTLRYVHVHVYTHFLSYGN